MITLVELSEKLTSFDEITLMELLNISSEDLVNRFSDKIEERFDKLIEEVDD